MRWLCIIFLLFSSPALAYDNPFRSTDLPLPRFVSLGKEEVNVRTGPGQSYPIKWVFHHQNLPVEIILEYGSWRKIRDYEGAEGWIHKILLSGRRYGIVQSPDPSLLRRSPSFDGVTVAKLSPYVVARIHQCRDLWCEIKTGSYTGWIERKNIWGVYENENFD